MQLFTNSSQLTQLTAAQSGEMLLACNAETAEYGLTLTPEQVREVIVARDEALQATGRIEFSGAIPAKLARAFCDSPYLHQSSYAEQLSELIALFYDARGEIEGRISDDALIARMRKLFDDLAEGSIERLRDLLWSLAHRLVDDGDCEGKDSEWAQYLPGILDSEPDSRAWALEGRDTRDIYTRDW